VVVDAPEVVAVEHGGKGTVEGENFEAVVGEIQFTDDFGTEERDYVGAFRKKETREYFFGDRGATEDPAAFEDEHFLAGLGQVGGVDEAVVTASDDDYIVGLRHSL
jgi:hypothetical protein